MWLMKWAEKKIRKMSAWNMAMAKIAWIAFGMVIGAYLSSFVKQYVYAFVIVLAVLYIVIIYKFFKR